MEMEKAKAIVENLLLVSDKPLTVKRIKDILGEEAAKNIIDRVMFELMKDYADRNVAIEEVAMGYKLTTRPEYTEWIKKFFKIEKGKKLSNAAVEVLSIVAYKQPITRAELEAVRGVDSGGIVRSLFDKKLIKGVGRKKVIGQPLMYGTTKRFLEYFGLKSLIDLPTVNELQEGEAIAMELPLETAPKELYFSDPVEIINDFNQKDQAYESDEVGMDESETSMESEEGLEELPVEDDECIESSGETDDPNEMEVE